MTELRLPTSGPAALDCHLCGANALVLVPRFAGLARVTSDCQPWPKGGTLGVCGACGTVQKVIDDAWTEEIRAIYRDYAIYHQSGGVEQPVFDRDSGQATSRSSRLLSQVVSRFPVADRGRLLDVGCGNGALLRAFSAIAPGWSLSGTEWDDKYREVVEGIPGVESLWTCPPEEIPGEFDLITMVHVLEHIPSPRAVLERLRARLAPGGLLVIHLPDHRQNPFELTIADHSTHFATATVGALVMKAGYEVAATAGDWVSKELTLVARREGEGGVSLPAPGFADSLAVLNNRLDWLEAVVEAASEAAEAGPFGLFGTSIAATWLTSCLGDRVAFYVDEDPSRVGKRHLGRPILDPASVPTGSTVFLALTPLVAEPLRRRLEEGRTRSSEVSYRMSPPFPASNVEAA